MMELLRIIMYSRIVILFYLLVNRVRRRLRLLRSSWDHPWLLLLGSCKSTPPPPAYTTENLRIVMYSFTVFLFYLLGNRLRRRLRLLRSSCERPWLLILGSCKSTPPPPAYITETVLITVYFHLVFSSYVLVNRVRRRLRLLRSSCESLCILT